MQLDIFNDSRDVMLRNDVLAALERYDPNAAQAAWHRLAAEYPADEALAALALLIEAVPNPHAAAFTHHHDLAHARRHLEATVVPAARHLFGANAVARWVTPLWRALAARAQALSYSADHSTEHAAALWLAAQDWPAAIDAVKRIESWRRIPAPLGWMAEARCQADGLDASWGLLAELAWLATPRFDALVKRLTDPRLAKLLARFDASFEVDSAGRAWFPAWLLTEDAKLARWLERAERSLDTEPEQAMRTMLELLRLEHLGRQHDIVERRARLRSLNKSLFDAYISTR